MVYWEEGKRGVIYRGRFCPVWSGLYLFESDLHHRGALEDISRTLKAGKNDAAVVVEVEGEDTPAIINPLKGKSGLGWHFEQNVYSMDSIGRALKAGGGSGNIPKVIIPVDDYNGVVAPDDKRDVIGSVIPNFGTSAPRNGWKIIEVYEDDEGASGEVLQR